MLSLILFFIIPYFCIVGTTGAAHYAMYSDVVYNNSWKTSFFIVGLFWPLTVLLAVIVFTLRAFDVNI